MGKIYTDGTRSPVTADDIPKRWKHTRSVRIFGVLQIFLGLASIALGVGILIWVMTNCAACSNFDKIGAGVWGGVIILVAGITGIKIKPDSSVYVLNTNLTLNVLCCLSMVVVFAISFQSPNELTGEMIGYIHQSVCGVCALTFVVCVCHVVIFCIAMCRPRPVIAIIYENPRTGEQQILYEDASLRPYEAQPSPVSDISAPLTPIPSRTVSISQTNDSVAPLGKRLNSTRSNRVLPPQEVYPTTERMFMGVINQISHQQSELSNRHSEEDDPSQYQRVVRLDERVNDRVSKKSSTKVIRESRKERRSVKSSRSSKKSNGHCRTDSFRAEPFFQF